MGGIVFFSKNADNIFSNQKCEYKDSRFTNPMHGTRRVCVRTGPGANDVVKYGLTSNTSASKYCGFKMRMPNGSIAMLGMYSTYTSSSSRSTSQTASRSSQYNTTHQITGTASSASTFNSTFVTTTGTGGSFTVQGQSVNTFTYKPETGGIRVSSVIVTFPVTKVTSTSGTRVATQTRSSGVTYTSSAQATNTASRSSQYNTSSSSSTKNTLTSNNINL